MDMDYSDIVQTSTTYCGRLYAGLSAAVSAGGHRRHLHHPHPLRPGPQIRRGLAAAVRQLSASTARRPARSGMSSFQARGHRHRRPGGHRQHHRLRHRHDLRRPRRHLLDVGVGLLRHGHHLRRGGAGHRPTRPRTRRRMSSAAPSTTSGTAFKGGLRQDSWRASSPWPSSLALGFIGNMVQSNSIGNAFQDGLRHPHLDRGRGAGGDGRLHLPGRRHSGIASVTEKLVPVMAGFYLVGGLVMLMRQYHRPAPRLCPDLRVRLQAPGHPRRRRRHRRARGHALRRGPGPVLQRGRHGLHPPRPRHGQGGKAPGPGRGGHDRRVHRHLHRPDHDRPGDDLPVRRPERSGDMAANPAAQNMAQAAFSTVFGSFGNIFVAICLLFFAFSTIIGWYFFGEHEREVPVRREGRQGLRRASRWCAWSWALSWRLDLVWNLSDLFNAPDGDSPTCWRCWPSAGLVAKAAREGDALAANKNSPGGL